MRYRMLFANMIFPVCVMILILASPIVSDAAFTDASLNGDYWMAHFEYTTFPYHRSELGIVTCDGSGNYAFNGIESKEGVGADLPVSDTGTYSVTPDGQISFDGYNVGRLSYDGEIVIGSIVSKTTSWDILTMVKKTTSNNFTDASLNGDYWMAHFEYTTFPHHRTELGTVTFDGSGNYTFNGTASKEGVGADLPVSGTGTYSVTPDGQISFNGYNSGRLSYDGEVVIASNVSKTTAWDILTMVKKIDIKCPHCGDVNLDEDLTPGDALLAFEHYLGMANPPLTDCQLDQAEVTLDGDITPADALCIFQKYLGIPSCLDDRPECPWD